MIAKKKLWPRLWFRPRFLACRPGIDIPNRSQKGERLMNRSRNLWLLAPLALASALDANVIADWTAIGSTTIVAKGAKSPPESFVLFAYSGLAMYDAVN